jgi:hypothetical protein
VRDVIPCLLILCAAFTVAVACSDAANLTPKKKYVMSSPVDGGEGFPQIVDGTRQDFDKWPATLGFKTDHNVFCTSTVVGEVVVVTAAHCVGEGRAWWVDMGNGPSIKLSCDLDPRFTWRGLLFDIALCKSDRPFPRTFMYENLDLDAAAVQDKGDLFLLGYGCRKLPKPDETPKTSAQLYGGLSTVTQLPKNPGDHIVTKGGVVICNGDSGGAAYVLVDGKIPTGPRSIVGMNSSYVQASRQSQIASLAADATATTVTTAFPTTWASQRHVQICGLPGAANCRDKFVP